MTAPVIHVLAGVLRDNDGNVLVAQRPAGKHMAGDWEFPGGKRNEGEVPEDALSRELEEELGIRVVDSRPLIRYVHDYPDRRIDLDVWQVEKYEGRPRGREGQVIDWVAPGELMDRGLLPADRPVVNALTLPHTCLITGHFETLTEFEKALCNALQSEVGMVQIRVPGSAPDRMEALVAVASPLCRSRKVLLIVNGDSAELLTIIERYRLDGLHLPATALMRLKSRPEVDLLGASCHDRDEIMKAQALGADYAFLSPVKRTSSHPEATPLGWRGFNSIVSPAAMPVFALGGLCRNDTDAAWRAGAQGVAGITGFWKSG
ncbi:MAG: Nudix family hydrolase [Gammaproteobacteria bacterium]